MSRPGAWANAGALSLSGRSDCQEPGVVSSRARFSSRLLLRLVLCANAFGINQERLAGAFVTLI